MSTMDTRLNPLNQKKTVDVTSDLLRTQILKFTKDFKTSWVSLGQSLYSAWKDKLYHAWGYDKFEYYTERELGLKKETALKLLKTYLFLEQDEPAYLTEEFQEQRGPVKVPGYESINLLRLAKQKKELNRDDYLHLKGEIFEKGKDTSLVRKDLTALIKERKIVDPDEERDKRNKAALQRFLNAVRAFKKDMESLKLSPAQLIEDADRLMKKLEKEVG
ncbi:MAG: hypothetical protein Q8Q08_01475 [Candidatus Omnitrophota bacterium]|nr:hypothetical protein [Candidatus Omnitrophota bacterium]MDZ4242802.1 hypothetical protein [Candidatus Omnitrophota bacterium]